MEFCSNIYEQLENFVNDLFILKTEILNGTEIENTSQLLENVWCKGYDVINRCNYFNELYTSFDIRKEKSEIKTVRCFVYYNMCVLWKKLTYIDNVSDANVCSNDEVLKNIKSDLNQILSNKLLETENNFLRFTESDAKILLSEIRLFNSFDVVVDEFLNSIEDDNKLIIGDKTIYNNEYVRLLKQEKDSDFETIKSKWVGKEQRYGYWQMLQRKGEKKYLPIPYQEYVMNPNFSDNV